MAMPSILETKRLLIREWGSALAAHSPQTKEEQLDAAQAVLSPKVLQYLPESLAFDPETDDFYEWVNARRQESTLFLVSLRESEAPIGFLILAQPEPMTHEIYIGLLFGDAHWGAGYGTEMLEGLLNWYHAQDQATTLHAGVEAENTASHELMKRLGFAEMSADHASSGGHVMYQITINSRADRQKP